MIFEGESRAIEEIAKAGGKLADVTGKGIDAGAEVGRFLSGSSLKEIPRAIVSILGGDWIIGKQIENIISVQAKIHAHARSHGLKIDPSTLPWRIKLELIRGMADEDESNIQDVWARIVVDASRTDDHRKEIDRVTVETIKHLTPLSASLLRYIECEKSINQTVKRGSIVNKFSQQKGIDPESCALIMDHITQLRCVQHSPHHAGGHQTTITALGRRILQNL